MTTDERRWRRATNRIRRAQERFEKLRESGKNVHLWQQKALVKAAVAYAAIAEAEVQALTERAGCE